MNHFRSFLLAVLAVTASSAHAEVSTPRQVADRPAAHCQAPRFAPDGTQLAYDAPLVRFSMSALWAQTL